ncbi:hypothetical protein KKD52_13100 [Myxococcota bacterium]|nr:hypothetical protein [Myxococcota bacterium]MBU1411467.1 hypothetical protein [Myxococcota bacterium]MBU1511291.1 hypothetical protein [Myxococcota bacterium]
MLPLFFAALATFAPLGCNQRQLDLIEDDRSPRAGTTDPGKSDATQLKNNAHEIPVRPVDDHMDRFQSAGTRIVFRDLSIAPSFHWDNAEYRLFQFLYRLMLVWDQLSYRSAEEAEISTFFQLLLNAQLTDEDSPPGRFREVRAYAMPIFLKKRIPEKHRPSFTPAELEKEAFALYDRGFNMNQPRQAELRTFLAHFGEVGWRDHTYVPEDRTEEFAAALRDETIQLDREDAQSVRRCIQQFSRKGQIPRCEFGRYTLEWTPAGGLLSSAPDNHIPSLELSVTLDTGRGRDLFQDMLTAYQKKPGWFTPGIQLPQIPLYDRYVIAATGPDALSYDSTMPPGNPGWPQNLRQTDWEHFSGPLLEATVDPAMKTDLSSCGPSLLDSLSIFSRYAGEIRGRPGDGLTSSRLFPSLNDGEVLERTWTMLWFLHAAASGHHTALGLKPGCENHALKFLAVRALWLLASQETGPDLESASLILLFRTLLSQHLPPQPAKEEVTATTETLPTPAPPEAKPVVVPTFSNVCDPKNFPELENRDLLVQHIEAAWTLLAQTEIFLTSSTAPSVAGVQLVPPDRLKSARAGLQNLSLQRTYLPALLRLNPERVSYRRAKDALDYYLQISAEARRSIKGR